MQVFHQGFPVELQFETDSSYFEWRILDLTFLDRYHLPVIKHPVKILIIRVESSEYESRDILRSAT